MFVGADCGCCLRFSVRTSVVDLQVVGSVVKVLPWTRQVRGRCAGGRRAAAGHHGRGRPAPNTLPRNWIRVTPAAASLREGLEEMFTVARLGIDGRLAKTLTTSNPVKSMISIA